jgi:hypothetical protein
MNTHVENLLKYIRNLRDLIMLDGECGYQHIGAAITDAVLQAGVN